MSGRRLPDHAYALFEAKGAENAARVRRVVTLIASACDRAQDWTGLRVLDLGCGEGLFALEAALHGASVLAVDARDERMSAGRSLARELDLPKLEFVEGDVTTYRFEDRGPYDIVLFLGLLYHLDAPALFEITRRAAAPTTRALVVDTYFTWHPDRILHDGNDIYHASVYREHRAADPPETRRRRLKASLTNPTSVWLTLSSLTSLLQRAGFPTVLECHAPLQPFEPADRITLLALKGDAPGVVTYPWINETLDHAIDERLRPGRALPFVPPSGSTREATVTDVVISLGTWLRDHPSCVLATQPMAARRDPLTAAPDVAVWRRHELATRVGGLGRVAPLLAIEIAGPGGSEVDLLAKSRDYLAMGVEMVWLVVPEALEVVVVEASRQERFGLASVLPAPPGLPGPGPPVRAMFHQILARDAGG